MKIRLILRTIVTSSTSSPSGGATAVLADVNLRLLRARFEATEQLAATGPVVIPYPLVLGVEEVLVVKLLGLKSLLMNSSSEERTSNPC